MDEKCNLHHFKRRIRIPKSNRVKLDINYTGRKYDFTFLRFVGLHWKQLEVQNFKVGRCLCNICTVVLRKFDVDEYVPVQNRMNYISLKWIFTSKA